MVQMRNTRGLFRNHSTESCSVSDLALSMNGQGDLDCTYRLHDLKGWLGSESCHRSNSKSVHVGHRDAICKNAVSLIMLSQNESYGGWLVYTVNHSQFLSGTCKAQIALIILNLNRTIGRHFLTEEKTMPDQRRDPISRRIHFATEAKRKGLCSIILAERGFQAGLKQRCNKQSPCR